MSWIIHRWCHAPYCLILFSQIRFINQWYSTQLNLTLFCFTPNTTHHFESHVAYCVCLSVRWNVPKRSQICINHYVAPSLTVRYAAAKPGKAQPLPFPLLAQAYRRKKVKFNLHVIHGIGGEIQFVTYTDYTMNGQLKDNGHINKHHFELPERAANSNWCLKCYDNGIILLN